MKPSERLKEIEAKLSRNRGGMRYCATGEETEFLVARVKKLTEALNLTKEACWDGYQEIGASSQTATKDSLWSDQFAVRSHLKLGHETACKVLEGDE